MAYNATHDTLVSHLMMGTHGGVKLPHTPSAQNDVLHYQQVNEVYSGTSILYTVGQPYSPRDAATLSIISDTNLQPIGCSNGEVIRNRS